MFQLSSYATHPQASLCLHALYINQATPLPGGKNANTHMHKRVVHKGRS